MPQGARRDTRRSGSDIEPRTTPQRGAKGGSAQAPPQAPPPAPPMAASAPPPHRGEPPKRRPGATAGLVLIVVGAIFLLAQLIPGIAWWTLWPLVIVGAGIVQAVTPGREGWGVNRLFDGISTAVFGLVLLAVTTGFVGIGVFWKIISLWPVLLIALGLELLGKALNTAWVRASGSVLVIAVFAYSVGVSSGAVSEFSISTAGPGQTAEISEPVSGVQEATLEVDAGVATVALSGGDELIDAEGTSPWGRPVFTVTRSGPSADVQLSTGPFEGGGIWPGSVDARLDARISERVLWDIVLKAGVSSLRAELDDVQVRELELKPGVADASVKLGEVPRGVREASVLVEAGVSSVTLRLPKGEPARIESDSGLTGHTIDEQYESLGSSVWESEDFEQARKSGTGVWIIKIKSGIGSVAVQTY